jgi:hexosaminidase
MKLLPAIILITFLISCSQEKTETSTPIVSIVPLPASITTENDSYELSKEVTISANSEDEKNVAGFIINFLQSKNINASVTSGDVDILIKTASDESIGEEGYNLDVSKEGIKIEANNGAGLFYGVQTLFQLISGNDNKVPFVQISDQPRFSYRGLHLDVGRNMFPVDFIKKYIDMMSHYKYNTFHWHLSEDQGWRIEIKKYPKLQEVAAYRN